MSRENRVYVFAVASYAESMNDVGPEIARKLSDCLRDGGVTSITPVPVGPSSFVIVECLNAESRPKEEES